MTGGRRFIQSFYYYSGSPRPPDGSGGAAVDGRFPAGQEAEGCGVRAEGGQAPSWGLPGVSIPFQGKGKAWRGGQVWNRPMWAIPADCAVTARCRAALGLAGPWPRDGPLGQKDGAFCV